MPHFIFLVSFFITILVQPFLAEATMSAWQDANEARIRMLVGGTTSSSPSEFQLGLEMELEPGWRTYWRSSGESGSPLSLEWSGSTNVKDIAILWPIPTRKIFSQAGYLETYTYEKHVTLPLQVNLIDPSKETFIDFAINYVICKDSCIMKYASFMMDIPPGYQDIETLSSIDHAMLSVPKVNGNHGISIAANAKVSMDGVTPSLVISAHSDQENWKDADLFVDHIQEVYFRKPEIHVDEHNPQTMIFRVPIVTSIDHDQLLLEKLQASPLRVTLVYGDNQGVESMVTTYSEDAFPSEIPPATLDAANERDVHAQSAAQLFPSDVSDEVTGIQWLILVMAFLGGALLNIMPCVLPVVSIKLFGLLKKASADVKTIRVSCFATTLGVMTSYIALAVLTVAIQDVGGLVGLGFHFQEPGFVIFSILVLMLFAYNLWGYYEISIPSLISHLTTSPALQTHAAHSAHFFNGAFATLLATPCSAPLLGTAVSFALTHDTSDIFLIFSLMGLGMSTPYLLFMIKPTLIKAMPKPGPWMLILKAWLGILLAMTALWLLWILSSQLGYNAAIALFLALILMKFVLQYRGGVTLINTHRFAWMVGLTAIAFIVPYHAHNYVVEEQQALDELWQPFIERDIAELVASGKVVFVDVTADWCVTCKMNKFRVLEAHDIMRRLNKDDVIAMRADMTTSRPSVSHYIQKYKRFGIPFNIVYGPNAPEGILLSEWLSKDIVIEALEKARK